MFTDPVVTAMLVPKFSMQCSAHVGGVADKPDFDITIQTSVEGDNANMAKLAAAMGYLMGKVGMVANAATGVDHLTAAATKTGGGAPAAISPSEIVLADGQGGPNLNDQSRVQV